MPTPQAIKGIKGFVLIPAEQRFWAKVNKNGPGGCWLWTGGIHSNGYGEFSPDRNNVLAHRYAYESLVGPIPAGFTIDHLCRTRACVRPEHLETVTQRTNILRGVGIAATNAIKTYCDKGHSLDLFNTYITPNRRRQCRECRNRRNRQYRGKETILAQGA